MRTGCVCPVLILRRKGAYGVEWEYFRICKEFFGKRSGMSEILGSCLVRKFLRMMRLFILRLNVCRKKKGGRATNALLFISTGKYGQGLLFPCRFSPGLPCGAYPSASRLTNWNVVTSKSPCGVSFKSGMTGRARKLKDMNASALSQI